MARPRLRGSGMAWLAAASLASCLDHNSEAFGTGLPALSVTAIEPALLVAYKPTTFTVRGTGFVRTGGQVLVTFRTDDGTPFANGTAAEAQVVATVISDTEIRGTTPATTATGVWPCSIAVTVEPRETTSATPLAMFHGLTVLDADTESVRADIATRFQVAGLAFPTGAEVTVRFTAVGPALFPGASNTLDVPATVPDAETLCVTTPVLALAQPVLAYVGVILDTEPGQPRALSTSVLVRFELPPPVPVVVDTITAQLPIAVATQFTITGSGFLGAADPAVDVTFAAIAGTPFDGGTAATFTVPGTATSDTTIVGNSPTGASHTNVTAIVTVARADDVTGTSASDIALFTAPVPTADTFTPIEAPIDVATAFSIGGTNLPAPGTATVRFVAVEGTPFAGGTSDRAEVLANLVSPTRIDGATPLAVAAEPFGALVTVLLPGNVELPMGEVLEFTVPSTIPIPVVVTNLNDGGPGSLRTALLNTPPGNDITFAPSLSGTISVQSTMLVSRSTHVLAPSTNPIRLNPAGDFPVFTVAAGVSDALFQHLTVRGANRTGDGGAFAVHGRVTLIRCELTNNRADGRGAGIFVAAGGTVRMHECTLDGNSAKGRGGAVFVQGGGTVAMAACTCNDNTSDISGGAVALEAPGTLSATNCTFFRNRSKGAPGGGAILIPTGSTGTLLHCTLAENRANDRGGAVFVQGTLHATNCIFARNSDGKGDVEIASTGGTNHTTFSLLRVGAGSGLVHGVDGNLVGTGSAPVEARLGPLQKNGGATRTMALKPTCPARDAATATIPAVLVDQRHIARPHGTGPDMGAYEADVDH